METTPIHSRKKTSFPSPLNEAIALLLLLSHPPSSLYVVHGMEHGSEDIGRMRPALHPERIPHPIQLCPDEYNCLYRVWAEQVRHEPCGEGKSLSVVQPSLQHGWSDLFVGGIGLFLDSRKLLCLLRSLGCRVRVYGDTVAYHLHCLQAVAS